MNKFLIFIFLTSCSSIQHKDFVQFRPVIIFNADSDFIDVERSMIKNSINKWQEAVGNSIYLDVKFVDIGQSCNWRYDGIPTIYKATSGWKYGFKNSLCPYCWGWADFISGDIFIFEINYIFERLIIHEIGHILMRSSWHAKNPYDIMWQHVGTYITKEDIRKIKW